MIQAIHQGAANKPSHLGRSEKYQPELSLSKASYRAYLKEDQGEALFDTFFHKPKKRQLKPRALNSS